MAKKKLKRLLKKAAPLIAAGLGAAALGRRKQNQTYLAEEGGDRSDMRNYGPYTQTPIPRASGMKKSAMTFPAGDYSRIQDYLPITYKKGGRVGGGKAKRGLGRAFTKRKK